MQRFGLLNHFFPSFLYPRQGSSNLAHSFSVNLFWHHPPKASLFLPLAILIWVSRSVLLWPFLLLAFFLYGRTILTFALWRSLVCSYALLFYPIPDRFLFAILHFHKLDLIIFFSKFSFQISWIYWLLFLLISMFHMHTWMLVLLLRNIILILPFLIWHYFEIYFYLQKKALFPN